MKYKFVHSSFQNFSAEETIILDNALELIMHYDRATPFLDMALFLSGASKADYVLIGEIVPQRKDFIRSLAYVKGNTVLENVEYLKTGTACENVIGHNVCYYPTGVQQIFPEDDLFRCLNIQSYMGSPLNDKFDNTIGIVALISSSTIARPQFLEYLLTTVSPFLEDKIIKY